MPEKKFWQVKALADENGAQLSIYGDIGDESFLGCQLSDVSSKQIKKELNAIGEVKTLHVYINSPGGDVFTAQAIYSMLRNFGAYIVVHVDGIAASAASLIAMAGDEIIMPANAMMMIHNPSAGAYGQAADLRKGADVLDKIRDTMIVAYGRTGKDRDELIAMLDAETWMTGEEAVEAKFADRTEPAVNIAASAKGNNLTFASAGQKFTFASSRYKSVPGIFVPTAIEAEKGLTEMSLEDLKAQYPELTAQIANEATAAERDRIKGIADFGAAAQTEEGYRAMFDEPKSPEAFAAFVLKTQAKNYANSGNRGILNAIQADANMIPNLGSPSPENGNKVEMEGVRSALVEGYKEGK